MNRGYIYGYTVYLWTILFAKNVFFATAQLFYPLFSQITYPFHSHWFTQNQARLKDHFVLNGNNSLKYGTLV